MISKKNLQPVRAATLAALMLVTLSGCAGSGSAVLERHLPEAPAWAEPVMTPDPRPGEDALAIAARERKAKAEANSRITEFKGWYDALRDAYARGQ